MSPEQRLAQLDKQIRLAELDEQIAVAEKAPVAAQAPEAVAPAEERGTAETIGRSLSHIAGGFNKGIVDTVNAPFAASKWLGQKVFGDDPKAGFDLYGIPKAGELLKSATAPALEQGDVPIADMMRTGLEWGGAGARKLVNKGADIGADLLMGLGAASGSQAGGEVGEVAGGITGFLADALRGKLPSSLPFTESRAKDVAARHTEAAPAKAKKFIEANMIDPQSAVTALRGNLEQGTKGTLLDLTEDVGLTGIERSGGLTHGGKKALIDTQAAREAQVVRDISAPFGDGTGGTAEAAAKGLANARQQSIDTAGRNRIKAQEAEATRGLAKTRAEIQAADDTVDKVLKHQAGTEAVVAPTRTEVEASESAFTRLQEAEDAFVKGTEKPAWKAFDDGPPVDAFSVKMAMDDVKQKIQPETMRAIGDRFKPELADIAKWSGDVDPKSVSAVRSAIKDKINSVEHYGTVEKRMDEIVKGMDDYLEKTGGGLYSNAVKATRDKYNKFSPAEVGKQRRKASPSAFLDKLKLSGGQGKTTAQNLKASESEDALEAVDDYFRAKTQGEKVDAKFMRKYEGFLNEFSGLRDEYADLAQANAIGDEAAGLSKSLSAQYADQAKGYATAKAKAEPETRAKMDRLSKAAKTRVTAQYADNPEATIKRLLGGTNSVGELKKLRLEMADKGAGESFKASVGNIVKKKLLSGKTGTSETRPNVLEDLYDMKGQLVDSGLITAKDFDNMMAAGKRSTGSKGLRKTMIDAQLDKASNEGNALGAAVLSSLALKAIPTGHALLIGNALTRNIKRLMRSKDYSPEAMQRVDSFLSDPQSYLDAQRIEIPAYKDPEKLSNFLAGKIVNPKAVAAGQTVADDRE